MTTGADHSGLLTAVHLLRSRVDAATLPLDLPDAVPARDSRTALLSQLDDYVVPRLSSLEAPLLAVVGGSTGAGKSTLVNSLVGSTVSRSGVLRPTTRGPVLVHHVDDARWFTGPRVLPELPRTAGAGADAGPHAVDAADPGALRLIPADALPAGLALLDAPDIDSVVRANRDLARQLLAAADLWLFVTTAARYADAVPWDLLHEAAERGTSVAVVLDRVPAEAMEEVRDHFAGMLREQGLAAAPVFTIPEAVLTPEGHLPDADFARLRSWLAALARDAKARSIVVRRTLTGALDSLRDRVDLLAAASAAQVAAAEGLRKEADAAYRQAAREVELGVSDGTLLRGEVLARWQELVGTGELLRQVEASIGRLRDRFAAAMKGQPAPTAGLGEALHTGVAALLLAHAQGAAATTARRWRELPGGAALLAAQPELATVSADLEARVERLVRDWQGELLELVRAEGKDRRTTARVLAFGVNGLAVVLMLVAFSQTAGLTGAEVGIAGGAAVLAQRVLEAVFGDQAVRDLAAKSRRRLLARTRELYDAEQCRFDAALERMDVHPGQAELLSSAAAGVEAAR